MASGAPCPGPSACSARYLLPLGPVLVGGPGVSYPRGWLDDALSTFTLAVRVSPASERGGAVQALPLIDGRDVVGEAFEAGPAHSPEELLGRGRPLEAGRRAA